MGNLRFVQNREQIPGKVLQHRRYLSLFWKKWVWNSHSHENLCTKKKSGGLSSDKFLSRATCKSQKMLQRVQKKRIWILFFLFSYLFGCAGLNCSMWDLVPWPGTKPRPPAVGAQSLSHWTTREVLRIWILNFHSLSCQTTLCSRTAGKTGSSLLERFDWHSLGFQREAVTQHANARGQCDFTKDHRKCSRSCFG